MKYKKQLLKLAARQKQFDSLPQKEKAERTRPGSKKK